MWQVHPRPLCLRTATAVIICLACYGCRGIRGDNLLGLTGPELAAVFPYPAVALRYQSDRWRYKSSDGGDFSGEATYCGLGWLRGRTLKVKAMVHQVPDTDHNEYFWNLLRGLDGCRTVGVVDADVWREGDATKGWVVDEASGAKTAYLTVGLGEQRGVMLVMDVVEGDEYTRDAFVMLEEDARSLIIPRIIVMGK